MTESKPSIPYATAAISLSSLYFDTVIRYWRYPSTQHASLHRACVVALGQGANVLVVEDAASFPHVTDELQDLIKSGVGQEASEARALSFFHDPSVAEGGTQPHEIDAIGFVDRAYTEAQNHGGGGGIRFLGQLIVINYGTPGSDHNGGSYIFEALMSPPEAMMQDDSQILLDPFKVQVLSKAFTVNAAYYCQQNGITSNCGHAAIRTLMSRSNKRFTSTCIDQLSNRPNFSPLMELGQLVTAVDQMGRARGEGAVSLLPPTVLKSEPPTTRDDVLTGLVTALESGFSTILTHATAHLNADESPAAHVVAAVGYAIDRNLWHPQAVQAYNVADTAPRSLDSAKWVRHLIVHDENFGPYRTLGIRSFPPLEEYQHALSEELPPNLTIAKRPSLKPEAAIGLLDVQTVMWPRRVLTRARQLLELIRELEFPDIPATDSMPGFVSDRNWGKVFFHNPGEQVLRPVIVKREDYLEHIQGFVDTIKKDRHPPKPGDLDILPTDIKEIIPTSAAWFWMVELSHTLLYTGLDTKIGELLIGDYPHDVDDDEERLRKRWWIVRLPGLVFGVVNDEEVECDNPVTDHGPMYKAKRYRRN